MEAKNATGPSGLDGQQRKRSGSIIAGHIEKHYPRRLYKAIVIKLTLDHLNTLFNIERTFQQTL